MAYFIAGSINMKPQGNNFDGSSTLFETHEILEKYAGKAV
jgi:hypothetical protein